jgi:hypothetical protein
MEKERMQRGRYVGKGTRWGWRRRMELAERALAGLNMMTSRRRRIIWPG